MATYNRETKLSDALMSHPSLIPLLNRMDIKLGVGDLSIGEICNQHNIDVKFFLSLINTYLDEEYFPIDAFSDFSVEKTISYLEKTGDFYLKVQLPNIENHFSILIKRSGNENNLFHLKHFFNDLQNQLKESVIYEKEHIFPLIREKRIGQTDKEKLISVNKEVEEKLDDLLTFFVVYLKGDYDINLCMAVVSTVFSLRKDLSQNNRIRTRILIPLLDRTKEIK